MRHYTILTGGILVLALSACAAVTPPTVTEADFEAAGEVLATAISLNTSTAVEMAAAENATYTGKIGSEFSGDADGLMSGDLTLNADFGAGTITGQASGINILMTEETDFEDQLMGGVLTIANGQITGSTMSADLAGTLTGSYKGFAVSSDTSLAIAGDFKSSDPGVADTNIIAGSVTGSADGDVYLSLSGEGGFVVCSTACEGF